jgi:glutathione S-transferase
MKRFSLMLTLRTSFGSPFGRKPRIAISVLGLDDRISVEPASTQDANDPVRKQNPLGKVPVLLLEDGASLFDSPVIMEYLDALAGGGKIIPNERKTRFEALRLQALCDGILEASVLLVYEGRYRSPEKHEPKWLDLQAGKVDRAFSFLETAVPEIDERPNVGQITLACALGYRDFRFGGEWRKSYPRLVSWLDGFAAQVPAFETTTPPPS